MRFRVAVLPVLVFSLFMSACGSSDDQAANDPEPQVTAPPTTVDPYLVPADAATNIEYWNRVLAALNKIDGDIRRDVYGTQSLSDTTLKRIEDLEYSKRVDAIKGVWSDESMTEHPTVKPNPGNDLVTVTKVREVTESCAIFEVTIDRSNVYIPGQEMTFPGYYRVTKEPSLNGFNPTPWKKYAKIGIDSKGPGTCS